MMSSTGFVRLLMISMIAMSCTTFARLGAEERIPVGEKELEDRAKWDCEYVVLVLVGMASDGLSPYTRVRATRGLGNLGGFSQTPNWFREIAIPALRERLADEDHRVRRAAALALGDHGPAAAPAVMDLIDLLVREAGQPQESSAAAEAAEALGAIGPPARDAIPALMQIIANRQLQEPDMLTEKVVWALEQIRREDEAGRE